MLPIRKEKTAAITVRFAAKAATVREIPMEGTEHSMVRHKSSGGAATLYENVSDDAMIITDN